MNQEHDGRADPATPDGDDAMSQEMTWLDASEELEKISDAMAFLSVAVQPSEEGPLGPVAEAGLRYMWDLLIDRTRRLAACRMIG